MIRRNRAGRRAAAAVELAWLLPFLMWLCVIAADWARLLYYEIELASCARAGALWASDKDAQQMSPYTTVTDAALAAAPDLGTTPTVTAASYTDASNHGGVIVTVSMDFQTITDFPGVPHTTTITRTCEMRNAPVTAN